MVSRPAYENIGSALAKSKARSKTGPQTCRKKGGRDSRNSKNYKNTLPRFQDLYTRGQNSSV